MTLKWLCLILSKKKKNHNYWSMADWNFWYILLKKQC